MLPEPWEQQSEPLSGAHGFCSGGMGTPCPWIPYPCGPGADPAHVPLPKALLIWQQMQTELPVPWDPVQEQVPRPCRGFLAAPGTLLTSSLAHTAWECSGTQPDPGADTFPAFPA